VRLASLWLAWLLGVVITARADLQFDAFVGYGLGANEGVAAEGSWFPITFEVYNSGPGFEGVIELFAGPGSPVDRVPVELPTGTRKRLQVPRFAASRWLTVNARLLDSRGKLRAEQLQLRPRLLTDRSSPLIGSLSRTLAGAAFLPEVPRANTSLQPGVARLSTEMFPDNVITLEGLSVLYLNSAKALELKAPQVNALLAWLHGGGHLVLGVEQPGDINGSPWLNGVLPCAITGLETRPRHPSLQSWLNSDTRQISPSPTGRNARPNRTTPEAGPATEPGANPFTSLERDPAFEEAPMQVARATLRDGRVFLGMLEAGEQIPLVIQAPRGRGTLTVLLFSPELEPFRTWKNRGWFWAKLAQVPIDWLAGANVQRNSGYHVDAIFGALIETSQIRKLPVGWLFVLLLAYLAVIGPVDHYVLKRLNKQMLTWVTFPAYVAFFSILIYYIGYRLRAGEAEWNEFHVVDVIPHGARADLRGYAYGAVYSPMNAQYPVASEAPCATLRGEVGFFGGQEVSKADVNHVGNSFKARLDAPIWTSQLYENDWWRQGPAPLELRVTPRDADEWEVAVTNHTGHRVTKAMVLLGGRLHDLGDLGAGKTQLVLRHDGTTPTEYAQGRSQSFASAVNARRSQWGNTRVERLSDPFAAAVAASFIADPAVTPQNPQSWNSTFASLRGMDLTPNVLRGDTILLAWMPDDLLVAPMNQFTPKRSHKQTLLRVILPPASPNSSPAAPTPAGP
jgi:hypothetical protein